MDCHFFLQGIFPPRDQICISCIGRRVLYTQPPGKPSSNQLSNHSWENKRASLSWSQKAGLIGELKGGGHLEFQDQESLRKRLLLVFVFHLFCRGLRLPWQLSGKESACSVGDLGSIPELGRSPGEGNSYPLLEWPGEFHGLYSPWGSQRVGHD